MEKVRVVKTGPGGPGTEVPMQLGPGPRGKAPVGGRGGRISPQAEAYN